MFRLKKEPTYRDMAVIISTDGTADVATVYETDHQKIYAANESNEYSIPIGDVRQYVGSKGKIYVCGAVPEFVQETKRLAELEKSIVLQQITKFKKEEKPVDIMKIILAAGIVIVAVVAAM